METILAYECGPQVVFSRPGQCSVAQMMPFCLLSSLIVVVNDVVGDSNSVVNLRREVQALEKRDTDIDSDDD